VAVHANLPLRALAALFVDRQLAHVFIVDDREMVVGMVKDADLLRATPVRTSANAGEIMGIALPVPERTPLRRALLQMAVTHVRQAAIMSADGTLLGVLADIDGLRWLAAAARR
jgi:predicted transcriptional regulator